MITRRQLIKRGATGTAGVIFAGALLQRSAFAAPKVAASLTPFLDPMPLLVDNAIDATDGAAVNLTAELISRKVHTQLNPTTLFGYLQSDGPGAGEVDASYLGPAILAQSGVPVSANYTNLLQPTDYLRVFTNGGSSYLQFLPPNTEDPVQILTHLHGGFVAGTDDGNPFAQPNAFPYSSTQTATYPMDQHHQPATLSWYHDHYLRDTRMNVVAGLAGAFLIRDAFDTGSEPLFPGPLGVYELPMVVQDRQFNADGSLLYPIAPASTNGPWIGEYFGDLMLVNGKIWPKLTVEPAVYRFRVLNGCNARILNLRIVATNDKPVPLTIIGTEGGLLPYNPVAAKKLVMAPAERFDVIADFRGFAGKTLFMKNTNPPSPVSTPAPPLTQVMQITVAAKASRSAPTSIPGAGSLTDPAIISPISGIPALTSLGPPVLSGGSVDARMITLNEIGAGTPSWELNLNAHGYPDPDNPNPMIEQLTWGNTEDWYFVNTTADTHPMHTHLFTFRVMGRYKFDVAGFVKQYGGPNGVPQQDVSTLKPFLKSKLLPPDPTEVGFKETVKANPGQVTVVRARFYPPSTVLDPFGKPTVQKYVHHCHIVEHEDNDMMEQFQVSP